uniref:Uncharacterized protein orf169c n=1 Tax=Beta vulgaris subsp. maritima TaxID=350892 RepID=E8ZCD4_BETVM|nr:hypothetical protein [Beta vulgaris subsp. maritima]
MYRILSTYNHQTRDQSRARQNRKYHGTSSFTEMELSCWFGVRTSMKVDLLRTTSAVVHISFPSSKQALLGEHSLSYLRSLDADNFLCAQVRLASSPPFSVLGNKETRNQKERREIGPCFPREAAFSQASSRLEVEDCSMRASLFPGLCSPVYAPTHKVIIEKMFPYLFK